MRSPILEALSRIKKSMASMDEEGMKHERKEEKEDEKEGEAVVSIEIMSGKPPLGKKKNPLDALK